MNQACSSHQGRYAKNVPDVDQLYMTAVQVLTPPWWVADERLSHARPQAFLWRHLLFRQPTCRGGRGFVSILRGIEDAYRKFGLATSRKPRISLLIFSGNSPEPSAPESPVKIDEAFIEGLIRRSVPTMTRNPGGFGGAPKFPRETLLELLLVYTPGRLRLPPRVKSQVAQRLLRHYARRPWPKGASAISLAAGFIAIRPMRIGSCRISKSCCMTMPCWRGVTSRPLRR